MSYPSRALSGVSFAAAAVLGLLLASPAAADELSIRPGIELFEEFSTNPTRVRDRDLSDSAFALRYKPNLEIETRGQTGFNRLRLGVNGRQYHESKYENRDANDRFANFDFRRSVTSRLSFYGTAGYYLNEDVDAILVETDGAVSDSGPILLNSDRPDIETLSGQFGFEYALNSRSAINIAAFIYDFDYDLASLTEDPFNRFSQRRDFTSNLISATYTQALSPRDTFFVQLSHRNTDFDGSFRLDGAILPDPAPDATPEQLAARQLPLSPEQEDRQLSAILGWNRNWSPTLTTSVNGGTRQLQSDRDGFIQPFNIIFFGVPQTQFNIIAPDDGKSASFTGSASLVKETRKGRLELFASRETRPSSGVSASVDETSYGFRYDHRLSGRVSATIGARNEFREAANESGFDDAARIHRYDASLRWRVGERWVAFVSATSTDSNADNLFFSSYSDKRVSFGFQYAFGVDELSPF